MTILTCATRAAAVAVLLGAAGGTALATDWDKLQSQGQGWSGGEAASTSAGTSAAGASDWGAEIASAFQDLGMEPARAECYGSVLTQQLPPDDQREAAELVRTASSADDVRSDVLGAGETLVGGFSAANTRCPEGMGG